MKEFGRFVSKAGMFCIRRFFVKYSGCIRIDCRDHNSNVGPARTTCIAERIESLMSFKFVKAFSPPFTSRSIPPPIFKKNFSHRKQHLALLSHQVQKQPQVASAGPRILLKDFNQIPCSPFFGDFLIPTGLQGPSVECVLHTHLTSLAHMSLWFATELRP